MNTIRFTTTEPSSPSSPTTPMTPSHAEALRYLAEVAAAQEWTDALNTMRTSPNLPHRSLSHIPARRRRHSRKARAGPPGLSAGVPADIRELVQKVMAEQASAPEPSRKPSLTLTPWSYPPIDEDAIAPPSPILMDTPVALAPFLDEAVMGDAVLSYDSEVETELETETETELETEIESDAGPSIHRPRVRVVIDDSEPTTPEYEAETYKKWSCDSLLSKPVEPLVISTPTRLIPAHPELTPVASEPVDIGKLVDSIVVEEDEEDDEWISGPPSYYTSPPESPHRSPAATPAATPACSPCATPAFTDDEYESEAESCEFFDVATDPIATHHLRNDLEIVRPFSPDAPDITFTPPTWEAFFECMPHQDEAYGLQLAIPGSTPLGPAELEHNNLVLRARIRRNPTSGAQECMWRGKWTPCCWACGGAAEGMDTSLPASQRTGWFVLDNQRWLMIRG